MTGRRRSIKGVAGWAGLALYVAVWDLKADETLSSAWARGLCNKRTRWALVALWAGVTVHLFAPITRKESSRGATR